MYSCQGGICQQRADKFATGETLCHMVALKKENHDRISTHHVRCYDQRTGHVGYHEHTTMIFAFFSAPDRVTSTKQF